jgi:hypothetical protein
VNAVLTTGELNYYATHGFTFLVFAVSRQSHNLIGKNKSNLVCKAVFKRFRYECSVFHKLAVTSCQILVL